MNTPGSSLNLGQIGVNQILNALADGVYVTDRERRIVFWNEAAGRITGWPASEVAGRSCFDNILVHVDKDGHALCGQEYCPLHRAIVTGEASDGALLVFAQHRMGHRVPVEVSVSPIRDLQGTVVGGIEVFRDLTESMNDLRRAKVIQDHSLGLEVVCDARLEVDVLYTPQELVGGDFYRVEQVEGGRHALFVADVMGHGVAAALYTMQLRVLWEDARGLLTNPTELMTELNRRLGGLVGEDGSFATAVLAVVDPATGDLRSVRAGHPAPLLVRRSGTLEFVGASSPALGLNPSAVYREYQGRLEPGDRLLLYSDAAVEVTNDKDEELGGAGLCSLVSGFGIEKGGRLSLAELEQRLLEYSNRIRLPDDLTLLMLRRK